MLIIIGPAHSSIHIGSSHFKCIPFIPGEFRLPVINHRERS